MKYLYFPLYRKIFISVVLSFLFSASITFSQNVGVSDLSTFSPQSLFHIYKNSSGSMTLMQLANSTTGSGSGAGLTFDVINTNFDMNINNRASGYLGFCTSGSQRMIILSGGNVGIGTISPAAKLEINNTLSQPALSIGDNGTDNASTYGMVNLTRPADLTRAHLAFIRAGNYVWQMGYVQNTNVFGIFPWNLTSGGMPTMAFSGSNVGIGTSSPSKKLDVSGDINFTGALYANGSAGTSGQLLYSNAGATNSWLNVGSSGQILISTGGIPSWQNPGGTEGYTRAVIPIASFGGEVLINSTSWQRVTRTTYTSLASLFSGVPVMSGYTRKYYMVIRKADNQPGGIGSYWRFSCDGGWNGGNDVPGHGFSLSSDWGSLQEGTTYWIEIPPTSVSGSGAGTQYWKIDAKMANTGTSMRVMYVSIAAVDIFGGTNAAYSVAGSGNATLPPMSMLYENIWSTGTSGNVGIGTMSPNFKTDIQSDITMSGDINPGSAQLSVGGATTPGERMILGYDITGNGYGFIKAGNYGVTWTPLSLQPNGGNVGIGTTTPGKKLDVQGGASFGASTYQSGAIIDAGNVSVDYPGNSGWASSYNSNILLSGLDYTTISFHDAGATVGELGHVSNNFFFDGGQAWGPVSLGINTRTPNMKLEILSGSDGICFGQQYDNTQTIQTYIDGQWANRASYAGGCCNALLIQPDVGVVGIGTTTPNQKLEVAGGTVRISALASTGNRMVMANSSGDLFLGTGTQGYGGNVQSVSGTADASTTSATYTAMPDMTITFTPIHSVVYVTFTSSGTYSGSVTNMCFAGFRIYNVTSSTQVRAASTMVGQYGYDGGANGYDVALTSAVSVTPGVSTTIRIDWLVNQPGGRQLNCVPTTDPNFQHRTLTILD